MKKGSAITQDDLMTVSSPAQGANHAKSARRRLGSTHRAVQLSVPLQETAAATYEQARPAITPSAASLAVDRQRRLLAEVCKVFGEHVSSGAGPGSELKLPPRLQQTLKHLVKGDSEKQVARQLGLSPHTVHVYVKQLYKRLKVSSRGELLAKFIRPDGF